MSLAGGSILMNLMIASVGWFSFFIGRLLGAAGGGGGPPGACGGAPIALNSLGWARASWRARGRWWRARAIQLNFTLRLTARARRASYDHLAVLPARRSRRASPFLNNNNDNDNKDFNTHTNKHINSLFLFFVLFFFVLFFFFFFSLIIIFISS